MIVLDHYYVEYWTPKFLIINVIIIIITIIIMFNIMMFYSIVTKCSYFELLHEFPNGFAACSDDACVDPPVQPDVLTHHILQRCHQLLYSRPGLVSIPLITRDHDYILEGQSRVKKDWQVNTQGTEWEVWKVWMLWAALNRSGLKNEEMLFRKQSACPPAAHHSCQGTARWHRSLCVFERWQLLCGL